MHVGTWHCGQNLQRELSSHNLVRQSPGVVHVVFHIHMDQFSITVCAFTLQPYCLLCGCLNC